MKRKTLKVFLRVRHGEIVCMCLRSCRRCKDATCIKDIVEYDQYQGIYECFKNRV